MKSNEVKSTGKKLIFLVSCVVLLLIFTSLSYGWGPNPKYDRLRERPHQELLSPPRGDQFDDILLVIVPNGHSLCLVFCAKKDSVKENPTSQALTKREVISKTISNAKK
jgi:hypothetical protein